MMRRTDITQLKSFSPLPLRLARVLLTIAAALVTVALLMASYWVGSLYSPTTILFGFALHPSLLDPFREAVFYAAVG